jgi:hypothetical protein
MRLVTCENTPPLLHGKRRKPAMMRAGSMIVELTLALALLSAIGITVFKSSLDLMAPRQWTIYQNISDAYISYEQAYAERVSFEVMTSGSSPWPVYPSRTTTDVEIGKFPGGAAIMATVIRTKIADANNLPAAGGNGTVETNPSEMETWQLQSHLTYKIGDDEYVKSRTVIRSQ